MAATQTSYIDENGQKRTGYIINGTTYSDAAGSTPVGVGSVVDTDSGKYIKTANGSMLYDDYLKQNGIRQTTTSDGMGGTGTGYIQNGTTYKDPLLQQSIGAGTIVDTDSGKYIKTGNGSMLYDDYLKQNGIRQTTTVNEQNGQVGTGYIQNGTTYKDPLLQQGIDSGTIVNTDDGAYIKTDKGSMLYSDYLKQQNQGQSDAMQQLRDRMAAIDDLYNRAIAANDQTTAAQLERQRSAVQQQIDALNQQYNDLNRQLYRDYMLNQKNMPQILAAQGLGGGLQESSLIRLAAGYESDLAANERARETGIRDLETGGRDAELQLQIEQARANQQAEENAYARAAAVQAAMIQQQNADRENERAAEEAAYDRAYQNAAAIGKATGDYSLLYELAGYTPPAAQPTYNPGYTPSPTPATNPGQYKTGSQKADAILQGAQIMQRNGSDADAANYIGAQIANGLITATEAQRIIDELNK